MLGGIYDAERFALTEAEYTKVWKQIRYGIMLCKEISSTLVSIHPPFFTERSKTSEKLFTKAQARFLKLAEDATDFASQNSVKIALESFCYNPFIFRGLNEFAQFLSEFPSERLGVLLDVGHLYQIGISPCEAVSKLKGRLLDIHVHDATREKNYKKATHLPVGKGAINFPGFVECLRGAGYDGWLTLEIRGTEEEIVESKQYLEHLIADTAQA
jgi:sugar phosphate isomerase/epimerase